MLAYPRRNGERAGGGNSSFSRRVGRPRLVRLVRLWYRCRRSPRIVSCRGTPRYRYVRLRWRILFAAIDWLGKLVVATFRSRRSQAKPSDRVVSERLRNATGDPRRILLVQLDHLGDAILSQPMLPALRARWPKATIEVLCSPWNLEVFAAAPEVDVLHVSRRNRFARAGRMGWMLAALAWGWRLRRRNIDLAIDVRGEFPLALILWLSGAPRRIGWACGGGGFLLTDSPDYVPQRHEVESRWALLAELGIRRPNDQTAGPRVSASHRANRRVAARLGNALGDTAHDRPRLVFHVGAGTEAKRWPVTHWRELVSRVLAKTEAEIVLVGGPGDSTLAAQIIAGYQGSGVVDWTGRLSIDELAALLSRAEVMVGADSGPAHLAAAVGTPVVALFSGTNRIAQWRPVGDRVTVLRHPTRCGPCHRQRCPAAGHPCMRRLTPKRVVAALEPWIHSFDRAAIRLPAKLRTSLTIGDKKAPATRIARQRVEEAT